MQNLGFRPSQFGLEVHGLAQVQRAFWNLRAPDLVEHALQRLEGKLTKHGAFIALTGEHTGRSPKDRFIVSEPSTDKEICWGNVNKPISIENYSQLQVKMLAHFQSREVFVQNCYAGADPANRLKVRVITESAWHNLFARNMFINPAEEDLDDFKPDFTVLHAPSLCADPIF